MDDQSLTDAANAALSTMFDGAFEAVSYDDAGAPAGDTSRAPVDMGQPRGADGRFLPNDGEEATEEGTVEEPEEAPEPVSEPEEDGQSEGTPEAGVSEEDAALVLELDSDVLELIDAKYGGDIGKALGAPRDAQALIGRQGSEVGDLRQENEMLQKLVQQMASLEARITPYRSDPSENPSGLVQEVIERAAQTGMFDENTYEVALSAWAEEEPFAAARLDAQVQMARQMAEQQALAQAQAPPTTLETEIDALKQRLPDLQNRLPAIEKVAGERPALARLLQDGDPRVRAQALEDLYYLAAGAGSTDTSAAARQVILRAKADADAAKADAAVVSASNTAPPPAPPPSADEALESVLKEHLGLGDDFKIV